MRKCDIIYKTGSTWRIAILPEEDRTTATGDIQRTIGDVWTYGS